MKTRSRADKIVSLRDSPVLHLVEEVHELSVSDVIEINHNRMQKASIATASALAVVAHGSEEHERVLFDRNVAQALELLEVIMDGIPVHDSFHEFVSLCVDSLVYLHACVLENDDVRLSVGVVALLLQRPLRKQRAVERVGIAIGPTWRIEQSLVPALVCMPLVLIPPAIMVTHLLLLPGNRHGTSHKQLKYYPNRNNLRSDPEGLP